MAKVTTKVGDFGCTHIHDAKIPKDSEVIDAIGAIDELQSALDMARLHCGTDVKLLERIQDKLRFMAGEIAGYITDESMLVEKKDIDDMEEAIDELSYVIPNKFVRFSHPISVYLNEARVRTRALERKAVKLLRSDRLRETVYKYINRLSDLFFVLSYKFEFGQ
ncbi:ATP:cob(I)alamin adenosyltransferase [Candidatus Woesearchaeota archaeon]|nr:ATP:cob(I)alamin adenosyltransferase [Candidatus Woesearchaeota archaeon]